MGARNKGIKLKDRLREVKRYFKKMKKSFMNDMKDYAMKENISEINEIKFIKKIEKKITEWEKWIYKWIKKSIPESYDKSRRVTEKQLKRLRKNKVKGWDRKQHDKKKIDLMAELYRDYMKMSEGMRKFFIWYANIIKESKKKIKTQIQEFDITEHEEVIDFIIHETIRVKEGREFASDKILEYIKRIVGEGMIIINGRNYDPEKYAIMLARTKMIKAQSEAVLMTCNEYDNDLVEVSRHDDPCPYCEQFEGKVYSISGKDPIYPMLTEYPPYHPNCEHSISPTTAFALRYREKYNRGA